MLANGLENVLILTGPTGAGKSALARAIAARVNAEIVAMDSMTVYRGMDIGTAKPSVPERQAIAHHLIDVLDPWQSANVAWWLGQAHQCVREIELRCKRALFVGGTPLYLKALIHGLFAGPPRDVELRKRLEQEVERFGVEALHNRLAKIDPLTAQRLHPNDVRRIVRALEVWEISGRAMSSWQQQWHGGHDSSRFAHRCIWLEWPRAQLYERINRRVVEMIAAGWVEEVRNLQRLPFPMSHEANQALGYRELFRFLEGKLSLPAAIEQIQTRSRQFAKRQLTWFRHLPECRAVAMTSDEPDPRTLFTDIP